MWTILVLPLWVSGTLACINKVDLCKELIPGHAFITPQIDYALMSPWHLFCLELVKSFCYGKQGTKVKIHLRNLPEDKKKQKALTVLRGTGDAVKTIQEGNIISRKLIK
jgi:hypothetical protein